MKKHGLYLSGIIALIGLAVFLTQPGLAAESAANKKAPAIVKPDQTGHFDFRNAKVFSKDICEHLGRRYLCLSIHNGENDYVMVLDKNGDEAFQLKVMPDGTWKQIWPLGESI